MQNQNKILEIKMRPKIKISINSNPDSAKSRIKTCKNDTDNSEYNINDQLITYRKYLQQQGIFEMVQDDYRCMMDNFAILNRNVHNMNNINSLLIRYGINNSNMGIFIILPNELILNIVQYLKPADLLRLYITNKFFNKFCQSKIIWLKYIQQQKFDSKPPVKLVRCGTSFKSDTSPMQTYFKQQKVLGNWYTKPSNYSTVYDAHSSTITSVKLCNNIMISVGFDKRINIYQINTDINYEHKHCIYDETLNNHADRILCLDLNDNNFVTGARDEKVKLWDLNTYTCLQTFTGHTDNIWAVNFYNDIIISAGSDLNIKLWDKNSNSAIHTINNNSNRGISYLDVNDNKVYVSSADGIINVYDIRTYNLVMSLQDTNQSLYGFDIKHNNLVCGGDNIMLWYDTNTFKLKQKIDSNIGDIYGVKIMNNKIITCGNKTHQYVRIWDYDQDILRDSKFKAMRNIPDIASHNDIVRGVYADDYRMITWAADSKIKLWSFR